MQGPRRSMTLCQGRNFKGIKAKVEEVRLGNATIKYMKIDNNEYTKIPLVM